MSKTRALLLLVVLCFVLQLTAVAQGRIDCAALNSKILGSSMRYCVFLPEGYDASPSTRYPVLYFLHGLGDNERSLVNLGAWNLVNNLRREKKIGDFLIVTPEGRRGFYVNSANGRFRYSDFFYREFLPLIERKYRLKPGRQNRAIGGFSMGGYGAFRFAFSTPDLFGAVSGISPALFADSPAKLNAGMKGGIPIVLALADPFGNPINAAHWRENDPFHLLRRKAASIRGMAIAYNCGEYDDYGFEAGSRAMHRQLEAEGIKHDFRLYPGDHSLAYFLSHLGEILEFHWRIFTAGNAKPGPH